MEQFFYSCFAVSGISAHESNESHGDCRYTVKVQWVCAVLSGKAAALRAVCMFDVLCAAEEWEQPQTTTGS
jgi:hypothetical protein